MAKKASAAGQPAANPFDMSAMAKLFDPGKMMDEFNKMLQSYSAPGAVNMGDMMDAQRKNMEALTEANRVIMEGAQAIIMKQTEMLQQAAGEAFAASRSVANNNPSELATQQTEMMARAYAKAVTNVQEVSEMLRRSQQEALQTLNERWQESLEEIWSGAKKK